MNPLHRTPLAAVLSAAKLNRKPVRYKTENALTHGSLHYVEILWVERYQEVVVLMVKICSKNQLLMSRKNLSREWNEILK